MVRSRDILKRVIYKERVSDNGPWSFFDRKRWQWDLNSVKPVPLRGIDAFSYSYEGVVTSLGLGGMAHEVPN